MAKYYKYMVECQFEAFNREMNNLIPKQREMVDKLFDLGVLITYTLAADRSRLWIVIQADSESELLSYIESLPMTKWSQYTYSEIVFHDSIQFTPTISLN